MSMVVLPNLEAVYDATPALDSTPRIAMSYASRLASDPSVQIIAAAVDANAGTVLIQSGGGRAWHLQHATCGDDGPEAAATAAILEMFGFGAYRNLYQQLNKGGTHSCHRFSH